MNYIVIGDIHSCADELGDLLEKCGYKVVEDWMSVQIFHPPDTQIISVGDLCDRGPKPVETLDLVMTLVNAGHMKVVLGNHDSKLKRVLKQRKDGAVTVKISHGLDGTLKAIDSKDTFFQDDVLNFLESLPTKIETDELIVVHGAYKEGLVGKKADELHMYGDVDRKAGYDDTGFPKRLNDWKGQYAGTKTIVHGHTRADEPEVHECASGGRVIGVDTGCAHGGKLTAYLYPQNEFISVPAHRTYWQDGEPQNAD